MKLRINQQIRTAQVRLIDDTGNNSGIVSLQDALDKARDRGLDLVEVAPEAKPPVCKIMDYSHYFYSLKKKEKENKKKSKTVHLKQIRLSPNIGKHDLKIKFERIKKFLDDGHNVKVNMRFKGRQKEHLEVGRAILEAIITELKDAAVCQSKPFYEGYYMTVLLTPITAKAGDHK
ncbi:MAG: translation initiation factor IF-3 [Elusimicrobiota bacterium]